MTHDAYKTILAKHAATGQVKYIAEALSARTGVQPERARTESLRLVRSRGGRDHGQGQGASAKLEDWIFANIGPPMLTPAQVKDAARTVGGITDFDAQYPRPSNRSRSTPVWASCSKVNATPTFFINRSAGPAEPDPCAAVF